MALELYLSKDIIVSCGIFLHLTTHVFQEDNSVFRIFKST